MKWLLVDGFNHAYRSFYALPDLTSSKGFPTGALHGWIKGLWKLMDQEKPDATLVFFDLGESQDRLALLKEYKAQRKPMPEPLVQQIEPIKAITRAMGLAGIEQDGVESDDLLASEAVAGPPPAP
jgi:DNA polymerase-1